MNSKAIVTAVFTLEANGLVHIKAMGRTMPRATTIIAPIQMNNRAHDTFFHQLDSLALITFNQ